MNRFWAFQVDSPCRSKTSSYFLGFVERGGGKLEDDDEEEEEEEEEGEDDDESDENRAVPNNIGAAVALL